LNLIEQKGNQMLSRKIARRVVFILGCVVILLLTSVIPAAESVGLTADNPTETTSDEPRHTQPVVVFGPYRLIQPPARGDSDKAASEPEQSMWTGNVYKIKSGDTLSRIAPRLGFSVSELSSCSGIINPNRVSIGQTINKPGTCVTPPPARREVVVVAETVPISSSAIENVINFAMAQRGDPYVWGGDGPNVWDCSGLVHAAFARSGINTSRSTKTLINEGRAIGRAALMRGDLVFPSSGHVGIYIGNGQMIHAPQSGDVVKVSPVYAFYAGRRLL
jgi:cell wall-associated NlpC family hydrolase